MLAMVILRIVGKPHRGIVTHFGLWVTLPALSLPIMGIRRISENGKLTEGIVGTGKATKMGDSKTIPHNHTANATHLKNLFSCGGKLSTTWLVSCGTGCTSSDYRIILAGCTGQQGE